MRTEFGTERSSCACDTCKRNCRMMPGFLIPADLGRMFANGNECSRMSIFKWAEDNLLASPGALVMRNGEMFRIPTLVPAKQPDGSCINLSPDGLCQIHDVAPFGCAFFDCHSGTESFALSRAGLIAVYEDHARNGLYSRIWQHLFALGKTQDAPEVLRKRYEVNA